MPLPHTSAAPLSNGSSAAFRAIRVRIVGWPNARRDQPAARCRLVWFRLASARSGVG